MDDPAPAVRPPGAASPGADLEHDLLDELTGLPSRARLLEETSVATREGTEGAALVHVDLVDFQRVVHTLGHELADELRRRVAMRLRAEVRGGEVLARVDVDTFAILLTDLATGRAPDDAEQWHAAVRAISERVQDVMADPFSVAGTEMLVVVAVGAAVHVRDAAEGTELARNADAAMYEARRVPSRIVVHSAGTPDPLERLELAGRLRGAIGRGELELHYQPITRLDGGAVAGVEALVRWRDPERGLVPPDAFIPLAESTGVIEPLGDWVLEELCRQAAEWEREGLRPNLAYNVSPRQLRRTGFGLHVLRRLAAHGVAPRRLVLELTESAWTLEAEDLLPTLAGLRADGLTLAIDDFGAGYSSLWRLREMPVQIIKLDRTLLRGVPEDPKATEVIRAAVHLAAACGCDVVAEGVETAEQLALVRGTDCRFAQGYLLARPMTAEAVLPLLREQLADDRR